MTKCSNKRDTTRTQSLFPVIKAQAKNYLTGEWVFSHSIWYKSELIFLEDGTFKFHDQGCYGQRFTEGKWTTINDKINLLSFDTYKQKEDSLMNLKYTDTIRIYLNNVKLKLRNDTFYCIGPNKLPEGARFYRARPGVSIIDSKVFDEDKSDK